MIFGAKYDCIYEAKGKTGDSLESLVNPFITPLDHYACFSDTYWKLRRDEYAEVTYRIYLFKEDYPDKNFNICTHLETKKILRCLQKTVPFTYKFEEAKYKKSSFDNNLVDFNVLVVHIRGNYAQHLWITSMLRCFFEWPYNIAAKEACALQSKIKNIEGIDLEKENWINLYLTIAAQLGSTGLHGVVDLGKHPKAKTYQEWKQTLASIKGSPKIIEQLKKRGKEFSKGIKEIRIYNQDIYNEGVESRASKYIAAYKDKLSWKK